MGTKQVNGQHVTVYDMKKPHNLMTRACIKTHEAALVLRETGTPITPEALTDLIGHEFADDKNVGRATSILAHSTPPVFRLIKPTAGGRISAIEIVADVLPPALKYVTQGDARKYRKSDELFKPSEVPPPKPPPTVLTLGQILVALPGLGRRDLLVLRLQVQEQLKDPT